MTFGRWLLVHSFSIFLVGLLLFGYLYREELQLEQAYQQLLNLEDPHRVVEVLKTTPDSAVDAKSDSVEASLETEKSTAPALVPAASVDAPQDAPDRQPAQLNHAQSTLSEVSQPPRQRLLMSARQAFWDREYPASVGRYQELLSYFPDSPDYNGELGNVYYAMNDYERAAQQYYRAAMILLGNNQIEAARQLVSPVTAMDRALGDRLQSQLRR